jgi:hypothetical protein
MALIFSGWEVSPDPKRFMSGRHWSLRIAVTACHLLSRSKIRVQGGGIGVRWRMHVVM